MAKKSAKHQINPDPLYNDIIVSRFINQVMRKGKKTVARKIVYEAFDIIKEKTKKEPLEIFKQALDNASPQMEVRPKRVGGATYQVPYRVELERSLTLAMRWIIKAANAGKGKPMKKKLAEELNNASQDTGTAVKKKENIHKMAQANRAFGHFARNR